jgi:hypothetical protein
MAQQALNYRVFHSSSQDSHFPASELASGDRADDDHATGW